VEAAQRGGREEREGSGRACGPLLAQRGREGRGGSGLLWAEERRKSPVPIFYFYFPFFRISIMGFEMNLKSNLVVIF
jgi:hypothetical protein